MIFLSIRSAYVSLVLPGLLLAATHAGFGQCTPPIRNVLLIAVDGGARRDTVFFGHGPTATTGLDTALCERELPPPPPGGVYDLRFSNPPGRDGSQPPAGLGQGTVRDYRALVIPLQTDTFRVRFQPGLGGYPVTFTWLSAAVAAIYDSARLIDQNGGIQYNVSMVAVPSLAVTNPAVNSLLLITYGVLQIPAAPALMAPPNGAPDQSTSLLLTWSATAGAARYAVQVAADSLFSSPLVNDTSVTSTSRMVSGLPPGTSCFWRVRAANSAGTSSWSPVWYFTTIAPPGVPQLVRPGNGAVGVQAGAQLVWNSTVRAASYHVQVASDSLFGAPVIDDMAVADTTRAAVSLAGSTRYFWRVAGNNGAGQGGWSAVRNFTTAGPVTSQYAVQSGWNMISLPLAVADGRLSLVYPSASSSAFSFGTTGYLPEDSLRNGTGYWLKFPSAQNVAVTGLALLLDTLHLQTGWNLVGTISVPVDSGSIQEIPPGLLSTSFFGFSGSYVPVNILEPGKSYWVKAVSSGDIVISTPAVIHQRPRQTGVIPSQK